MTIESQNAKEEIEEILEACIKCGLCKSFCPVFKIIREETVSPRGFVLQLNNNIYERVIYECNLCMACEEKCPVNIKLCTAFRKARKILVEKGDETLQGSEMIRKIREKIYEE